MTDRLKYRDYFIYPQKHRPLSWTWLKMWCVAWWHSGRDDEEEEDDEDEACGAESSRTAPGYDDVTLTPVSLETPVPSVTSRCDSLGVTQSTSLNLDIRTPGAASAATISTARSVSNNDPVSITLIFFIPYLSLRKEKTLNVNRSL